MKRYKVRSNWKRLTGMGLILLVACGCNTLASSSVSVIDQFRCGVNHIAGVQLLSDAGSIKTDSARISIGKPQKDSDVKNLDQDQFWIVRVDMGRQPSGGYGLRLMSEQLEISSDRARVALEWLEPKAGLVQIQALTYPCLYLKVAKGNYSRLEIVDQEGVVRHRLNLK
ncbi:MAG: protease complex subunit PrcB family protein [Chromatiales bacterium]|jgi:hypothetical protein